MPLDIRAGLIFIRATLFGPTQPVILKLALDTGASRTVISHGRLLQAGYDPASSQDHVQLTTGSITEFTHRLPISRLRAFGIERTDLSVVAHTLPPAMRLDGLLGLDFLEGRKLTIDFRNGTIEFD